MRRLRSRFAAVCLIVLPAGFWAGGGQALETVRVEVLEGAPRLAVDGKPVRARMFWGAPGPGLIRVGPQAQQVAFQFTAEDDEPGRATLHFRFGTEPGTVVLDDVRILDLTDRHEVLPPCRFEGGMDDFTREWSVWPPDQRNTVGSIEVAPDEGKDGSAGLKIVLKAPADGNWPDFHIYHHPNLTLTKGHRYEVSFWARAEPSRQLNIALYRPGQRFVYLGGPPGHFASQIQLAAEAGVDFVSFPIDMPWPKPGDAVDWSSVDQACRRVLEANPKAMLLPRIPMDPPAWWCEANPDDVMLWDRGGQQRRPAVPASPQYRRDAADRLRALVEHLEAEFGEHVAGYHPCGQNTGEWFYEDTWLSPLNGYSQASQTAWRRWLEGRYRSDAALQAAWGDPAVRCAEAVVPSPEARRAAPAGTLRDPVRERPLIDFAQFQQEMMAECVCHFARAVREASQGRKLVVFFYGYVFEFGAIANGPAVSGHYALRQVLQCPDIDVLCSPISYFDRGLGQSAPAMTAAESVALAGKMWLYEDDTRTHIATGRFPGWQDGADTLEQTNAMLLRNTGQCAVRNFGTWWMDLGASGWFDEPAMWARMEALRPLDEALLQRPRPFRPEVAAVIDEQSMIRVAAGGDKLTRPAVYEVRRPLGRMGAPYGQYLLDDVTAGRVRAKMYVFLTPWCLTPEQRRAILSETEGATRIWCYAPAYQEPDRIAPPEAMQELTGFRLQETSQPQAWAVPTEAGKRLGLGQEFGTRQTIRPLFAPVDAKPDETLFVYPDGTPAVALRRTGGGWSLFVGPPGLTSELLRLAAERAGVHLFTRSDCNVYANGPFLVLHAAADGAGEIDTETEVPVIDLLTGEAVGSGPKISLDLQKGVTRVLRIGSP
ncbi:MAG: hypothetical protein GYA33_03595 [Thermogutta sp.]|nr:hypothetical protein [Thermogutta sp.]